MSCIRFNTAPQRAAMQHGAVLSSEDTAVLHLAPPVTASKIARLRLLATHANPAIRCAVAASRHAPADLLELLARDDDHLVRSEIARNEAAPGSLLLALTHDPSSSVRSWLAVNWSTPPAALAMLSDDADAGVRRLAGWRTTISTPVGA